MQPQASPTNTNQPNQELPQDAVAKPVGETNQFSDMGLQYSPKRNRVLFIWLIIILVAAGALGAFLFLTEQGREIIGLESEPAQTQKPDTANQDEVEQIPAEVETVEPRDLENAEATEAVDAVVEDIDTTLQTLDELNDFEDFDAEAEFGAE